MTISKNDVFAEIGVDLRPDSELTRDEIIARNLKVVDFHFHTENPEEVEKPSLCMPMTSLGRRPPAAW